MCLLTFKPKGVLIPDNLLRQSYQDNQDGWGVCRSVDNQLVIKKGMTFKGYESYIKSIPEDEEIVAHVRWGNIGSKKLYNCHPFRISEQFCMFHNGTIDIKRPMKEMSDTFSFAHNIIAPILERRPEVFLEEAFRKMIEEAIGINNKLIIMRNDGKIVIFNEKQGQMYKGLWISNGRSLYGQHFGTGTPVGSLTYTPNQPNQHPNRPTVPNTSVTHRNPAPEVNWDYIGSEGYCG